MSLIRRAWNAVMEYGRFQAECVCGVYLSRALAANARTAQVQEPFFDPATGYWYCLDFDSMKTMPFEEADIDVTTINDGKPRTVRGLVPVRKTP